VDVVSIIGVVVIIKREQWVCQRSVAMASNIVTACLCCTTEGAVIANATGVIHNAAAIAVLMKPRLLSVVLSSVSCLRLLALWLSVGLVLKGNLQLMLSLLSCIELAKVVSGAWKIGQRGNMHCWMWTRLWMGGDAIQTCMNKTGSGLGDDEHEDVAEYWEDEGP